MKIVYLSLIIITFAVTAFAQVSKKSSFPNELKGYELIDNPKLEQMVFGVTTKDEGDEITKDFISNCQPAYHDNDACKFDENWDISFTYSESEKLSSIRFYPRKQIPKKTMKFSRAFVKQGMGIVHSADAGMYTTFTDKYDLTYAFVDDSENKKYRKGDLFYIEYGDSNSK